MKRIIIIVLSISIIFGFLFWKFAPNLSLFNKAKPAGPITLTYWGLWEDDNLIKPLLAEYQSKNPNVVINYERKSSLNYRTRVQTQAREGVGPDIFRIHNSWLPMFRNDLAPAPAEVFTLSDYKGFFYPVAADSFTAGNQIYGAPMEVDGLALFYNEELLAGIGGKPPKNWQEFIDLAVKMTVKDESGVKTAGAAMGTAGNVDHWSDILGLLLLQQPGVDLANVATTQVAEVLRFYTGFVTDPKKKTWDVNLPKSTDMFASGRLGFYFAPSWRAHELRVANPNLKFKVAPVPQLSGKSVAWASFWGEVVSAKSQNPTEAWKFIEYLTSAESQRSAYQQASQIRLFGEPYSQVSLSGELVADPIVGAFVTQGPNYKFWYLSSNTFDNGLNDEMIKYFEDGINAMLAGTNASTVLQTVDKGVKQVLDKYTKPAPLPSTR
ncbi:MAG: ABC transporter sugar-binding protein [Candidatus Daviesbacteria bacterium GW2011_GWF2_38_7]|nr:MAG: ABC transporter sugar-binding protein [Candidatus Daviesbacteria bacterium GW2011_GWF2_38_7]